MLVLNKPGRVPFGPNSGNFSLIIGTLFGSDQLTMAEAQPEPQNRPEPRGANCQPSFLAAQAAMASGQTGPLFEVGFSLENYHLVMTFTVRHGKYHHFIAR